MYTKRKQVKKEYSDLLYRLLNLLTSQLKYSDNTIFNM